jgi:ABC-type glycerol-3-phosphate transport system substrate-binding protein
MHAAMRCISVDTKQKDAAWKYLRFLNTVEFNKEYNSSNIVFPHLMDLVKDPASWVSKEEIAKGFDKIASQLAVQHGFSLYPPAGFGEAFNGIILPALNDVWNGKKTAKDVLTAVVPEANKITEAYAKGEK